jgi:hypothetical protein
LRSGKRADSRDGQCCRQDPKPSHDFTLFSLDFETTMARGRLVRQRESAKGSSFSGGCARAGRFSLSS